MSYGGASEAERLRRAVKPREPMRLFLYADKDVTPEQVEAARLAWIANPKAPFTVDGITWKLRVADDPD